jgi:hypothetical protein
MKAEQQSLISKNTAYLVPGNAPATVFRLERIFDRRALFSKDRDSNSELSRIVIAGDKAATDLSEMCDSTCTG